MLLGYEVYELFIEPCTHYDFFRLWAPLLLLDAKTLNQYSLIVSMVGDQ